MQKHNLFSISLLSVIPLLHGCASSGLLQPDPVSMQEVWADRAEQTRLRWFSEIGAPQALETGLTGDGVRVTIMGEMVDPGHPDLTGKVASQTNAFATPGQMLRGSGGLPYKSALLSGGGRAN